jgi:hypothetical protein
VIIVDVFVPGAAKTKGSMVMRNRATGAMKESVVGSSAWRVLMAQTVRDDIARRQPPVAELRSPWPGAVSVTVVAYLAQPRTPRFLDSLWYWPIWERAGDLDKLVRNVLDALGSKSKNGKMNGNAIVDDNLVCKLVAEKHVAGPSGALSAGVRIVVETL